MKPYSYRLEFEMGGTFYEVNNAQGLAVAAVFFFPDDPEGKVRAETRARILADALNAHEADHEIAA